MAIVFKGDEGGYMAWLNAHPHGFVVNSQKKIIPSYLVLHRASCAHISKYTEKARPPGGFTERQYIKICAPTINKLRTWVKKNGRPDGSFSKECGLCKP